MRHDDSGYLVHCTHAWHERTPLQSRHRRESESEDESENMQEDLVLEAAARFAGGQPRAHMARVDGRAAARRKVGAQADGGHTAIPSAGRREGYTITVGTAFTPFDVLGRCSVCVRCPSAHQRTPASRARRVQLRARHKSSLYLWGQ